MELLFLLWEGQLFFWGGSADALWQSMCVKNRNCIMKLAERYSTSLGGWKQFLYPCEVEFQVTVDKTLPEINKTQLVFH